MSLLSRTTANTPNNEARLRGMCADEIRGCVPCKPQALPSLIEAILARHGNNVQSMNVSKIEPNAFAVSYTVRR